MPDESAPGFSSRVAEDFGPLGVDPGRRPATRKAPPADVPAMWMDQTPAGRRVEIRGWTADNIAPSGLQGPATGQASRDVVRSDHRETAASSDLPVRLTHPAVLWPDAGVTKQGSRIHAEIWKMDLPHIVDRPRAGCAAGRHRWRFFFRSMHGGSGAHASAPKTRRRKEILTIKIWRPALVVQASVLEIHVWGAKLDNVENRRHHLPTSTPMRRSLAPPSSMRPRGARPPEEGGARQSVKTRRQGPPRLRTTKLMPAGRR